MSNHAKAKARIGFSIAAAGTQRAGISSVSNRSSVLAARCVARGLMTLSGCLIAAAASAQSTFALSQLNRPSGVGGPEVNEYIINPTAAMTRNISDAWGSAASFGQAQYGVLKSSASATASAAPYGMFFGRSHVGFFDDLTFSSRAGGSGFATVNVLFSRTLSARGSALGGYATDALHLGTDTFAYDYMEVLQLEPSPCMPCSLVTTKTTINGAESATWLGADTVAVTIPIVFGRPTSLNVSLNTSTLAAFFSSGSNWTADAAHSLYWGGITRVTDAAGNVLDFEISSASGTNYRHSMAPVPTVPVPEPETFMLVASGLAAIAMRRRYRRDDAECRST